LSRYLTDAKALPVLWSAAGLSAAIVALIVIFLAREAWPLLARNGIWPLLTDSSWNPTEGRFGLAPIMAGTLLTAIGATLIAAPLGIASAIFARNAPHRWVARGQRALVTLLAGIPSVVFGFWGLVTIAPIVALWAPPGASLLTAIIVLAIMILPTVALTADAALGAVGDNLRLGAAGLGLSREATILQVELPAAGSGIIAGVLLSLSRALGETMAVLMVAGNVVQVPSSLFDPVRTLTANIALEMAYATGDHRSSLFASGLALGAVVAVLAFVAWRMTEVRRHG
jgi:phosphate transport system permease protein